MMKDFNLENFTFGEEFEQIINSQEELAKKKLEEAKREAISDPFLFTEEKTESAESDQFAENPFKNNLGADDFSEIDTEVDEMKVENPFDSMDNMDNINDMNIEESFVEDIGGLESLGQDRYINAMHAFVDYMPINLSVDRDIPSHFESLVDTDSELPTIVIEKLQNKMISLIHNLRKRPLPAIPTENRQPIVTWNGSISEFMVKLEESVTFTHGFDEEEFKAMKKIIIVENMNDKKDLDQNEIYVTRQDMVDSLLTKYNSIIDLTDQNCSINFKDNGKKYSFSIGGLGFSAKLNEEWAEEIRSKIVFMRNSEILLTGIAASPVVVSTLKEKYGFNIVNEINEIRSLAVEI